MAIDIYAFSNGDMSVGIPNENYKIGNIGELDNYEGQRETVREAFQIAFLTFVDNVRIVFSDELCGGD